MKNDISVDKVTIDTKSGEKRPESPVKPQQTIPQSSTTEPQKTTTSDTTPKTTTTPDPTTTSTEAQKKEPIVHEISVEDSSSNDMLMKKVVIIFTLAIVVGVISGFAVTYVSSSRGTGGSTTTASGDETMSGSGDVVESAGIADKETFKDSAEGILEEGGHEESGEGNYKLIREGGPDQIAYLISSTVDLSEFVGKEVRVYGETFASDKVSWLMDVGFVEVIK